MLKRNAGILVISAVLVSLFGIPVSGFAQAAAQSRVLGTVTAVSSSGLTIKPVHGNAVTVTVGSSARVLELKPGQKSLSDATPIQLSDISAGDRALVLGSAGENGALTARIVVAMKQSAIAARHRAEQEDWKKNGVGGIVKSVDPAAHTLVLAASSHNITIQASPSTTVRKYAEDSVAFKDARPSSLSAIKAGDQLIAKGKHSADGHTLAANAIVFGDFQNIAGLVLSVDSSNKTLTVKNLAMHKPVTLAVDTSSSLRKLPQNVAEMVARRLHAMKAARKAAGKGGKANHHYEHTQPSRSGHEAMGPGRKADNEFNRVLEQAKTIQLADLHKGDVVMVVASHGASGKPGTALTLLSGVAPMLRASTKASQSMFSSSWSLGGGKGAAGAGGGSGGSGQEGQQSNNGSKK